MKKFTLTANNHLFPYVKIILSGDGLSLQPTASAPPPSPALRTRPASRSTSSRASLTLSASGQSGWSSAPTRPRGPSRLIASRSFTFIRTMLRLQAGISFKGGFFGFFLFYVRYSTLFHLPSLRFHCVEDAGIEPRTVATTALTVRRSYHSARSHPLSARYHPLTARSHPHLARSHSLGISGLYS
jgi:hypothetical protein